MGQWESIEKKAQGMDIIGEGKGYQQGIKKERELERFVRLHCGFMFLRLRLSSAEFPASTVGFRVLVLDLEFTEIGVGSRSRFL